MELHTVEEPSYLEELFLIPSPIRTSEIPDSTRKS
jgi:hypothetical protein